MATWSATRFSSALRRLRTVKLVIEMIDRFWINLMYLRLLQHNPAQRKRVIEQN
jgi:hypothetical protein